MGMFDQLKMAQDMMKGMSPEDIKQLMSQAQESKTLIEDTVRDLVESAIKQRNLVSRDEVEELIKKHAK